MTLSRRATRRRASERAASQQQMITFPIRQDWFALPIQVAQKVVPLSALGASGAKGASMVVWEGQQVPLLDLEQHIYRDLPQPVLPTADGSVDPSQAPSATADPRHTLLIRLPQAPGPIGLIISEAPLLRRVPLSAFGSVPPVFLALSQMRCINAVITVTDLANPIFLLDLAQVLPPPLPPSAAA